MPVMSGLPDKINYYEAKNLATLPAEWHALIASNGGIPISLLGELAHNHYTGPIIFDEIVDLHDQFEVLRGRTVPVDQRWTDKDKVPSGVKVLSQTRPEISQRLDRVTQLANRFSDPDSSEFQAAKPEYQENIGAIVTLMTAHYREHQQINTVPVILLRGAEALKKHFPADKYIAVNAKRLDMYEKDGDEALGQRTMKFGLDRWQGLEALQGMESIHLVFPDDCISTAGSFTAALYALYQKAERGLIPRIEKVTIYAAVGVQFGIEHLLNFAQQLGINLEIVVGHAVYAYDQNFYLRRAAKEPAADGAQYEGNEAVVGDMGNWLS